MRGLAFWDGLARDITFAWRSLRKQRAFTLVSIVTLALGIGATTAIFTVLNGVVLLPLPYPDPQRLVTSGKTTR